VFNYITEIINRYNKKQGTHDDSSTPARILKGERHVRGPKILTEGEEEEEEEEGECYGDGGVKNTAIVIMMAIMMIITIIAIFNVAPCIFI
jgi:hypothetical protein